MADTTFVARVTTIASTWLQAVNNTVYRANSALSGVTVAMYRTALAKFSDTFSVKDCGATGLGVADDWAAFQAAIDACYSAGKQFLLVPAGTYKISKPLYLWGGAHYWQTSNGVTLIGDGRNSTVIQKTTNAGTGDGSAFSAIDAVLLLAPHDKLIASTAFNCGIKEIRVESTVSCAFGVVALGPLARCDVDGLVITSVGIGFNAQDTMYLSTIRRLHTATTTHGFKMDGGGTSNHLDDCFCTATSTIAYKLMGAYSAATALAADGNTGVVYQFNGGDWIINGLGSESTSATKIVETVAATTNRVIINNPYIQPQNNVANKVFVISGASKVIVNGGSVQDNSSPLARAGQLASCVTSLSRPEQEGLFLNNVSVLDTYAVASTGAIMQSGGSTKTGKMTVPTGVATAIYTVVNEEIGLFYVYLPGVSAGFRSLAMLGISGGNEGFAVLSSSGLTLTNAAGVISVQHAIGSDAVVGWKYFRFGDTPAISYQN